MSTIVDATSHSNEIPAGLTSSTDIVQPPHAIATSLSPATREDIHSTTPPSSLGSPAQRLSPPTMSERVWTRVDSPPSALTFLAAICSSPSVHWDGSKHHYLVSEKKGNPYDDAKAECVMAGNPHIVDPTTPPSSTVYGEHHFLFSRKVAAEDPEDSGLQKPSVTQALRCATPVDEEAHITTGPDYTSDVIPSSPTALSFSSPSHRMSCDFTSSSERSITLPLSSPGSPRLRKALSTMAVLGSATPLDAPIQDICSVAGGVSPQDAAVDCVSPKAEPLEVHIPQVGGTEVRLDLPKNCHENATRSSSPFQSPSPMFVDPILSPISSILSSPLSEPFDLEPPSAVSSHFNMSSSAVSSRSTSPLSDMGDVKCFAKHTSTGRRASINVVGTTGRRMSGGLGKDLRQRSDTAPPEPTPRKRRRRSSPSSPVLRAFQVHRVSSPRSPPPSFPKVSIASSAAHQENRHPSRKSKTKSKKSFRKNRVAPQTDVSHRPSSCNISQINISSSAHVAEAEERLADRYSAAELAALPMTGFLIETLALSRASAMAAPELLRAVLKSQPHLMAERSEARWSTLVRCILEQVPMFGRIERRGTVCIFSSHVSIYAILRFSLW